VKNPDRQQDPERLGKYPLLGLVGKGAMGVVYKSFDPHIRRPIALKTIRRDLLDDDGAGAFSARFRNEAQAAGRLLHPGMGWPRRPADHPLRHRQRRP
jgi:serine/threonine protein kinase